jgi:TolB protein
MKLKGWQLGVAVGCLLTFFLVVCGLGATGVMFYFLSGEENTPLSLREMVQEQSEETPADEAPVSPSTTLNRIAVLGTDSNIFTVAPDGSDKQDVTDDADDALSYRYPTWSPDGTTLAYVELEQNVESQNFTSALHIAPAGGGTSQRIETEFAPFYLYWSPTGEQLAFLSNWENSMALRTVTVGDENSEAKTIHTGMPFFFSWKPSGDSLFAHIGSDVLLFLDADGRETEFAPAAGLFQAPQWSRDGEHLAYVRAGEGRGASALAVSDANGENENTVREEDGLFSFNWSPDSRRVAYSFTEEMVGLPAFGALYVEDIDTGERVTVSEEAVISFFWSPDGTKLAYLVPEEHAPVERAPEAAPLRQEGEFWVRWYVWDGTESTQLALFSPTQDFLYDYIRYFDQYAQSVSLWSPDSQTLLYAGLSESGLTGIWTLPVAPNSTAKRISTGVLATWSPQ